MGWRLLTADLRGRGSTGKVEGAAGIPVHTADLIALIDGEGLDRVAFVGHSLGAMIEVNGNDLHQDLPRSPCRRRTFATSAKFCVVK
jgi:pimeloyl-ACP methyl ester carboxylesterase